MSGNLRQPFLRHGCSGSPLLESHGFNRGRRSISKYDFDRITINFSPDMFCNGEMAKNTQKIIAANGAYVKKFCIELTEQTFADEKGEQNEVKNRMNHMKQAGIKLYLDDFGIGYSSIARITTYPFSVIKIDKKILDIAVINECMGELIGMMIAVLKKHGYEILMEGVENEQGKQFALGKKVDYIQGFLYAKPVPLEDLVNYFQPIGQEKKREEKNER